MMRRFAGVLLASVLAVMVPGVAHATTWTTVYSNDFSTDGQNLAADWGIYDGPYGSDPHNCAVPSHDYTAGGYLHLLMSYEATTPPGGDCGAAWYTGGMQLGSAYASVNQRVTLRFREFLTDPAALADPATGVRAHKNVPMHWGNTGCWPANGEIDYLEGTNPTTLNTNIHYGSACGTDHKVYSSNYAIDFRSWHTVQVTRDAHTVTVAVDGTTVYSYTGSTSTLPDVAQRLVLQQECKSSGCPAATSPTSTYVSDIQVDWLTVENPA